MIKSKKIYEVVTYNENGRVVIGVFDDRIWARDAAELWNAKKITPTKLLVEEVRQEI